MRKLIAALAAAVMSMGILVPNMNVRASSPSLSRPASHVSVTIPYKPRFRINVVKTSAQIMSYKVRPGDSLSAIASTIYGDARYWPAIYRANEKLIQSPDVIYPGWRLTIPPRPAAIPAPPAIEAPAPVSTDEAAPVSEAPAGTSTTAGADTYSGAGTSSFQQCVIARESGGNSQVMNSSGHYGLYQFSYSTWVAYGGNAADFGRASVGEQNQVFANAMSTPGGANNWRPYDGC